MGRPALLSLLRTALNIWGLFKVVFPMYMNNIVIVHVHSRWNCRDRIESINCLCKHSHCHCILTIHETVKSFCVYFNFFPHRFKVFIVDAFHLVRFTPILFIFIAVMRLFSWLLSWQAHFGEMENYSFLFVDVGSWCFAESVYQCWTFPGSIFMVSNA